MSKKRYKWLWPSSMEPLSEELQRVLDDYEPENWAEPEPTDSNPLDATVPSDHLTRKTLLKGETKT